MQLNVQFSSTLQPDWSSLEGGSDIRAEKNSQNKSISTTCGRSIHIQDTYYQHQNLKVKSTSSSTRQSASPDTKAKRSAKPITPQSVCLEEDSDPNKLHRDKEMQKNLHSLQSILRTLQNLPTPTRTYPNAKEQRSEDTQPRDTNALTARIWPLAKECRKPKQVKRLHVSQGKMKIANKLNKVFNCKQSKRNARDTEEEIDER
ncbi:hypothetical protein Tco_0685796 [Tanacetum coccineum]